MHSPEIRLEKFAMEAEKNSQRLDSTYHGWASIDEVGKKLDLTEAESREIAEHLQQLGWATVNFSITRPSLKLTFHGPKRR